MADEKRLIELGNALRMIQNSKCDCPEMSIKGRAIWGTAHNCALSCLTNCPTVDAVEVKCKIGGWVYALWEAPVKQKYIIYCAEVKEIRIGIRNCRLTTTYRLEPIMYRGHIHEYLDEDFGKLVFLSENEAQLALAKMDGGDEDGTAED